MWVCRRPSAACTRPAKRAWHLQLRNRAARREAAPPGRAAQAAGVPTVPGSNGLIKSEAEAVEVAREVTFPVMIKATAGGGGRGMRLARTEDEFLPLLQQAQQEADACFGNSAVYLEKYVTNPRHIEFQARPRPPAAALGGPAKATTGANLRPMPGQGCPAPRHGVTYRGIGAKLLTTRAATLCARAHPERRMRPCTACCKLLLWRILIRRLCR